jgi:hypothetical protein
MPHHGLCSLGNGKTGRPRRRVLGGALSHQVSCPLRGTVSVLTVLRRAASLGVLPQDIYPDAFNLRNICDKAKLTLTDLEAYGRVAKGRGYLKKRKEKYYEYRKGSHYTIYRRTEQDWFKIDGTMPQRERDTLSRYTLGPIWKSNSCAIDATIVAAVMLDAGRMQVDQMTVGAVRALPAPTQVVRHIVCREWGLLSHGKRERMRDELRGTLEKFNPDVFATASGLLPVAEVLDICLKIPQLSLTDIVAARYCDEQLTLSIGTNPSHVNSYYVSAPIQPNLQALFEDQQYLLPPEDCPLGKQCTFNHMKKTIILDRLPPTLMVHLNGNVDERVSQSEQLFEDVAISYSDPKKEFHMVYRVVGCIMVTGTGSAAHFIVVWRVGHRFLLFDGLQNQGEAIILDGWFRARAKTARVTTVFLRVREADWKTHLNPPADEGPPDRTHQGEAPNTSAKEHVKLGQLPSTPKGKRKRVPDQNSSATKRGKRE